MRIAGEATMRAPVDKVWDALLDPAVLVRTIPGCERLEATGENAYAMTVTAGIAAVKGTYSGTCELRDLQPHQSLVMSARGAGAPGTIAADVMVGFRDNGDGTTSLNYDADTTVGGMIGGVGQRMLSSASRRMAGEFFDAVEDVLHGAVAQAGEPVPAGAEAEPAAAAPAATAAGVFTRPPRATDQQDFLKGVAVGAGLVLLGVVVGAIAGRRR
jgi:carbon monoxide dehydrogenase subunit G